MPKDKLYLDMDDVVFDTENFLRRILGGSWVNCDGLVYEKYDDISDEEFYKVIWALSDYSRIPMLPGASEGIKLLMTKYDVVFCTSCFLGIERSAKIKIAGTMGIPIILCEGLIKHKSDVDMRGGVLIDDNTNNLNASNADRKVCFYKKGNFFNFSGDTVFSWFELLDKLC